MFTTRKESQSKTEALVRVSWPENHLQFVNKSAGRQDEVTQITSGCKVKNRFTNWWDDVSTDALNKTTGTWAQLLTVPRDLISLCHYASACASQSVKLSDEAEWGGGRRDGGGIELIKPGHAQWSYVVPGKQQWWIVLPYGRMQTIGNLFLPIFTDKHVEST